MTGPLNCVGCKQHRQASKKLDLWNLPEVLVLHLKRFSFTTYSRDKVDEEVIFPLEGLDMSKHMSQARAAVGTARVRPLRGLQSLRVCAPSGSSAHLVCRPGDALAIAMCPDLRPDHHHRAAWAAGTTQPTR
jgi:hypothetical protein